MGEGGSLLTRQRHTCATVHWVLRCSVLGPALDLGVAGS
jgi:hypothetical protein